MRMSFSSKTAFLGSQVAPLRVHILKATSMAFERSYTSSLGMHFKKVKKLTQPAYEREREQHAQQRALLFIEGASVGKGAKRKVARLGQIIGSYYGGAYYIGPTVHTQNPCISPFLQAIFGHIY